MTFEEFNAELLRRIELALDEQMPPEHHHCIAQIMAYYRSIDVSYVKPMHLKYMQTEGPFEEEALTLIAVGIAKNAANAHMASAAMAEKTGKPTQ